MMCFISIGTQYITIALVYTAKMFCHMWNNIYCFFCSAIFLIYKRHKQLKSYNANYKQYNCFHILHLESDGESLFWQSYHISKFL